MRWECGECGTVVERHRPAIVCPECGTAGTPFVRADDDGFLPELGENMRDAWLQLGVDGQAPRLHAS